MAVLSSNADAIDSIEDEAFIADTAGLADGEAIGGEDVRSTDGGTGGAAFVVMHVGAADLVVFLFDTDAVDTRSITGTSHRHTCSTQKWFFGRRRRLARRLRHAFIASIAHIVALATACRWTANRRANSVLIAAHPVARAAAFDLFIIAALRICKDNGSKR